MTPRWKTMKKLACVTLMFLVLAYGASALRSDLCANNNEELAQMETEEGDVLLVCCHSTEEANICTDGSSWYVIPY